MIDKKELLTISLKNQYLLQKTDKSTVLSDLCGLQAQFANNPKYALRIRANDFSEAGWGDGLAMIWTFRGTLHAVKKDEIGLFLSARGVPEAWGDSWYGLSKELKPYWSDFLLERIHMGVNGREQLKRECLKKGMEPETLAQVFHGWGGLLKEMCYRGTIAYDTGTGKRFVACDNMAFLERDDARAILVERYFKACGPATILDCATFMGHSSREILRLVGKYGIPLKSVQCEGIEYFYLNEFPGDKKLPDCVYLAGFDQLIMGYKDRSRFMDMKDKRNVITNSGIVYPTVLLNGKLQARWKKDGDKLLITPFGRISAKNRKLIASFGMRLFSDAVKDVFVQG